VSESPFLELHVCVQVHLSRFRRFMAEPKSDHAEIHTTAQHGHGCSMPQRVWRHCLRSQRWTPLTCCGDVPRDKLLQGICAEVPAIGTREDRIVWISALLRHPSLQRSGDVRAQRCTSHLATFSETADMSPDTKFNILATQGGDLAVAQACLNCD
jgi:hypothetical protein